MVTKLRGSSVAAEYTFCGCLRTFFGDYRIVQEGSFSEY